MASHTDDSKRIVNIGGPVDEHPRHSTVQVRHVRYRILKIIAMVLVAVLVFAGSVAAATWLNINNAVQSGKIRSLIEGGSDEDAYLDPNSGKPINFVLIGQDTRDGDGNGDVSGDGATEGGLHNADTTMVVQIGADRNYVNLVSIPRDSLVDVPACHTSRETIPAQYGVQFNSIFANAYSVGGDLSSAASCTVNAVNALTGLHISNFIVVDFNGLSKMIDSIDGVDLCFPSDVDDPNTNMHLKKGMHHLNGVEATNYARRRHGNDTDGSDIMRTTRQQYLIKSVLQKAISRNLFTQTSQLYQLVMNAIRSLNFSSGMADTNALMGLALSLRNLKVDRLYSQTVPIMSAPQDPNRVVWTEDAKAVWAKFKEAKPLFGSDDSAGADKQEEQSQAHASEEPTEPAQTEDPSPQPFDDSGSPSQEEKPRLDEKTGLLVHPDGTLTDPETGGVVDPDDGSIKDPNTNQYVGISYRYLNNTICKVPEHSDD